MTMGSGSTRHGVAAVWACEESRNASKSLAGRCGSAARPAKARHCRSAFPCRTRRRCHLRVLLADDHGIVRRGLRSLIEEAGLCVVAEAADGLEALRLTEELKPDLLVLDIGMPRLSGIEVAARSQKLDRPPRVVILSMHADESYIIR